MTLSASYLPFNWNMTITVEIKKLKYRNFMIDLRIFGQVEKDNWDLFNAASHHQLNGC